MAQYFTVCYFNGALFSQQDASAGSGGEGRRVDRHCSHQATNMSEIISTFHVSSIGCPLALLFLNEY